MSTTWRRALVTGASSGIGRAIALEAAARGADVVLVARRASMLQDVADTVRQAHGRAAEILVADLTAQDGLDAVEARLRDESSPIDLLVNNAGFGTFGTFHRLPVAREDEEIRLNVLALVRLSHAALSAMVPRGHGGVLNVSSSAGFQAMPYSATYCSTKAFVNTFTECLHEEAKGAGVHVSALCPGYVRTEFQDVANVSTSVIPKFAWLDVHAVARQGLDAVSGNDALSVTGGLYRAGIALNRLLPRAAVRRIAGAVASRRMKL
ncbi:MAG TPA: SDR family oxidoreductase [Egibacteraceae bacterium]|nr:SDR family oxidoreductase [Egibacteraceae bacterium]